MNFSPRRFRCCETHSPLSEHSSPAQRSAPALNRLRTDRSHRIPLIRTPASKGHTMTTPVLLQHYIDGEWFDGDADALVSISPAEPDVTVAHGRAATVDDVDRAVAAARTATRQWAKTPAHERGSVLTRAAAIVETSAPQWGAELAREEGKTRSEGVAEVLRAAQIMRFYGGEGDREAGEMFTSRDAGNTSWSRANRSAWWASSRPSTSPLPSPPGRSPGPDLRQHRGVETGRHRATAGDATCASPPRRRSAAGGAQPCHGRPGRRRRYRRPSGDRRPDVHRFDGGRPQPRGGGSCAGRAGAGGDGWQERGCRARRRGSRSRRGTGLGRSVPLVGAKMHGDLTADRHRRCRRRVPQ